MNTPTSRAHIVGRYLLYDEIASGGMASVHVARMLGPAGFARTVAIKKLHPAYAKDPEFVSMFLDEARLAARIQHPNVVTVLDVVAKQGELFLVMDYIRGESLSHLLKAVSETPRERPLEIVSSIVVGALCGLHAAHEACSERGEPLNIVHRDVSPQNILVGVDGVARVLDFGIAKAATRMQSTRDGQVKGKLRYMAPEQVNRGPIDRRTDIYATGAVLWEAITGQRLIADTEPGRIVMSVVRGQFEPPSRIANSVPAALDEVVLRALSSNPEERYATALEMADAIERVVPMASVRVVGAWTERIAGEVLKRRAAAVALIERSDPSFHRPPDSDEAKPPPRRAAPDDPTSPLSGTGTLETGGTEKSAISVRHVGIRASLPRHPARRLFAIGAGVLMIALAVVALVIRMRRVPYQAMTLAASASPVSSNPAASEQLSPAPSATGSAAEAPSSSSKPAASTVPATKRAPLLTAKSTPKSKRKDCVPPYIVNSDGTHTFKAQCL